ncbi:MAG TPA: DinB family protein [Puia sp.]|nr:DinB family protein [Puia sp.]
MKSVFDKETKDEVINRINLLTINNKAQWGKMTVAQMVRHCCLCEEYYFGNIKIKRAFLGRILGKVAIRAILKNEKSGLMKNSQTSPILKVDEGLTNLEQEKEKWKSLIERYSTFDKEKFKHWFFGTMTKEQLGQFIYKHSDHHLRQFGV